MSHVLVKHLNPYVTRSCTRQFIRNIHLTKVAHVATSVDEIKELSYSQTNGGRKLEQTHQHKPGRPKGGASIRIYVSHQAVRIVASEVTVPE
jgi:hypothetical protein